MVFQTCPQVRSLREDPQIDFSTHNVKWTLSPDPPPPLLSITSTDKNLGPHNPRKTDCFRALLTEQGRKLYTHAPNLPIRKRDSQNFLVQKEANQGHPLTPLTLACLPS